MTKHTLMLAVLGLVGVSCHKESATVSSSPLVKTVEAPRRELLNGYLNWIHAHKKGDFDVKLPAAFLDLYDHTGRSIHYEERPESASLFIHSLLDRVAPRDDSPSMRPNLADAVGMFSELKLYESAWSASPRYTLFALTNRDRFEECKQQDEAMAELKKHAVSLNLNVVEVRVHFEPK